MCRTTHVVHSKSIIVNKSTKGINMKFRKLRADEIEVKVKQVKETGCVCLLYKTARTDMDILDETVGPDNWQDGYEEIKGNMYCKIGIWNEKLGQWIWKQDCGIESREDGEGNEKKGEASDAFKRAGFKWGIGRELYTAPFIWIKSDVVPTKQYGQSWKLADAFAKFHVSKIEYSGKDEIITLVVKDSKDNTVYTFGKNTKDETIVTTPPETKNLSERAKADIFGATSVNDLKSIYNAYATSEPIDELKSACAIKRAELEIN